jgi:zinc/manganese transport system substrate-binding protein/zinc transport system substrate-binding protein/manganese/iron transport system substrate-binding protein
MVCAAVFCLATFSPSQALATSPPPLNVVVTIPVLKDLTQQVGGPYVQVTSLLSGYENEHTYAPKPSDLIAVRKARPWKSASAGDLGFGLVKNAEPFAGGLSRPPMASD